uniref:Putative secreted protein n=1 Tax=Ixodes ricinus TaxID=34613 RepID=A0A6B0UDR1_IXORI
MSRLSSSLSLLFGDLGACQIRRCAPPANAGGVCSAEPSYPWPCSKIYSILLKGKSFTPLRSKTYPRPARVTSPHDFLSVPFGQAFRRWLTR